MQIKEMLSKHKKELGIVAGVLAILVVVGAAVWYLTRPSLASVTEAYLNCLINQDYEGMYALLTPESQSAYDHDTYINRQSNIYGGIEATNMSYTINEVKNGVVSYDLSMDTIAGNLTQSFAMRVEDGKVVYDDSLILNDLGKDDRVRVNTSEAARGEILDRNGNVLAGAGEAYSVGLVPGRLNGESDYARIASVLGIEVSDIETALDASWVQEDSFVPVKELSADQQPIVDTVSAIQGVQVNTISVRTYPYGEATSHVTGYIQAVNQEDLENHAGEGYTENSVIGRTGIEAAYETQLRGQNGAEILIVDADGNTKTTVLQREAVDGADVKLTLDVNLQQRIYEEYQNDESCSVALNPLTGEVLALVSTPSYSSNDFVMGLSQSQWDALNSDPALPMYNRFAATFAPGSTMKAITAAIGLDTGAIDPQTDYEAQMRWQLDSSWGSYYVTTLHAADPNNLRNALVYSDNVYFAKAASRIGGEALANAYDALKFKVQLPFALALNASTYASGDAKLTDAIQIADSGYGQGQILMNPVHLTALYTGFLNEGKVLQPYLVMDEVPESAWIEQAYTAETANTILQDLVEVVSDTGGTGHSAYRSDISLAGKTGTAEIKASQNDTTGTELGWFIAMTADPSTSQPIILTTMVEDVKNRGGSGYVVNHNDAILDDYFE